jgi:hypothetical protein
MPDRVGTGNTTGHRRRRPYPIGAAPFPRSSPVQVVDADLHPREDVPGMASPLRASAVALVAACICLLAFTSAPANARGDGTNNAANDLVRSVMGGLLLVSGDDRDMRRCDQTNDCTFRIQQARSQALLFMAATRRVPSSQLSPLGRRVQANGFEAFRRYFLAAGDFQAGSYGLYSAQLKQAITQGAAAATRLGQTRWFTTVMVLAGCGTWRIALRIPGDAPCQ